MKLSFVNYKISHIAAFVAAFAIHAGIIATSMMPSDPIVLNKQAIQVSFVAPSANNSKAKNTVRQEITLNIESKKALYKKQDQQKAVKEISKEKSFAGKETSGQVDENAVATRSAKSEPIFDAAYLDNPTPYYPRSARRKGIQGEVLLKVSVKTDGSAASVLISHSSGYEVLDNAALAAVKTWNFIPAKKSGKSVEASVLVPVEFKII
jgi:TonB family protein